MYLHFIDVKINLYKNKLSYTFQLFSLFPLIILEIPIASHPTLYIRKQYQIIKVDITFKRY